MITHANPNDSSSFAKAQSKQTFEFRVPDGSADIYLTIAGLIIASLKGINDPNALKRAQELYVDVNIFKPEHRDKLEKLELLPLSCYESAEALERKRSIFEANHIFPSGLIESKVAKLKSYDDKNLSEKLYGKKDEIKALVDKFLHVG